MIEDHCCDEVVFAEKAGEARYCLAYVVPLVATHGATDIQVE